MNREGSTDTDTFTGIYFEDLLTNILSVKEDVISVIVTANDGFNRAFNLNARPGGAYWADSDGNKMMLAWSGTASRTNRDIVDFSLPRTAIGQRNEEDINRSLWVSDVAELRVTAFTDLAGAGWAIDAIEWAVEAEVTTGVGDGRFDPRGDLDRAVFVTFLGRALGSSASEDKRFPDVDYDNPWYGMHIGWAVDQGYIKGYEDGTFGPANKVTVEHMLLIAENAGLEEENIPEEIEQDAVRFATRAEAVSIIYALVMQGQG
jgi:hypothetical protein